MAAVARVSVGNGTDFRYPYLTLTYQINIFGYPYLTNTSEINTLTQKFNFCSRSIFKSVIQ